MLGKTFLPTRNSTRIVLELVGLAHIVVGLLAATTGSLEFDYPVGIISIVCGIVIIIGATYSSIPLTSHFAVAVIIVLSAVQAIPAPIGFPLVGYLLALLLSRTLLGQMACAVWSGGVIISYIPAIAINYRTISDPGTLIAYAIALLIVAVILIAWRPSWGDKKDALDVSVITRYATQQLRAWQWRENTLKTLLANARVIRQELKLLGWFGKIQLLESVAALIFVIFLAIVVQPVSSYLPMLCLICLITGLGTIISLSIYTQIKNKIASSFNAKSNWYDVQKSIRLSTLILVFSMLTAQELTTPFIGALTIVFFPWPITIAFAIPELRHWRYLVLASCVLLAIGNLAMELSALTTPILSSEVAKVLGIFGAMLAFTPVVLTVSRVVAESVIAHSQVEQLEEIVVEQSLGIASHSIDSNALSML